MLIAAAPKTTNGFKSLVNTYGDKMIERGGPAEGNFFVLLGGLIDVLLSVLGVILLGFIIVAGFYWITAGGNATQVAKAKTLIQNAVIGLIVILMSLALSTFVQNSLTNAVNGVDAGTDPGAQAPAPTDTRDCVRGVC
jgi:hypothetical protein